MTSSSLYSVIQYSKTPERGEFVNVGLVLFAGHPPVLVQTSQNLRRIHKVFSAAVGSDIKLQIKAIENRIYNSFKGPIDKGLIDHFISMRTGNIRLSPARTVIIDDPYHMINSLYERFVSDQDPIKRQPAVARELAHQLALNGVVDLLEKPEPLELPQNVFLKADYGYQNSAYNYIKAISLRADGDAALKIAGKQAIIGSWVRSSLNQHSDKKLIVVADTKGKNGNFVNSISDLMNNNGVEFYTMDQVDKLSNYIKIHINEQSELRSTNLRR